MSWQLRISLQAQRDIEEALAWTLEHFGERQYVQYRELIRLALHDLAANPDHVLAKHRPEIHPQARTLHLSRRGKHARHFLLFRVVDDSVVEIGRLLHDAMELTHHLPPGYAPPP